MFKVLIVEDEDLIRKGIIFVFDWTKYDCVVVGEAANGLEALELIDKLSPDLLVTDIRMPKMDGLELIKQTRNKGLETIIISGHAEFKYARKAIEYGVNQYLLKPIDHKELGEAIIECCNKLNKKKMTQKIQEKVGSFDEIQVLDLKLYYNNGAFKSRYTPMVLDYIASNYSNKINIDLIADELEVSGTYLSKKFKEDTSHTFNDFLNKFRIQKALSKMLESDKKIYEIAEEVGYSEYKYFSQVFKNYLHYTPRDFQNLELFVN